mgnify:CR=1 FL=1
MKTERPPDFVSGSELLEASYRCARSLHAGPDAPAEKDFGHPVAVARLMSEAGFAEEVIAAALLHEVVEETDLEVDTIRGRFGAGVAALVAAMTEDQSFASYPVRKSEHRDRVGRDRRVAAIYVADKLATTRVLNEEGEEPRPERLDHFILTLGELGARHPDLPFLGELEAELVALAEV